MSTVKTTSETSVAQWRDRAATGLMVLAAISALVALVSAFSDVGAADSSDVVVRLWRLYGFVVFAGLFFLLAFAPRRYAGVWELVIADKLVVAITGFVLLGKAIPEAQASAYVDGTLALITIAAYLLAKGYSGWSRSRAPAHSSSPS
jgi:hypothetical protein